MCHQGMAIKIDHSVLHRLAINPVLSSKFCYKTPVFPTFTQASLNDFWTAAELLLINDNDINL
jgi:hypothetical protein